MSRLPAARNIRRNWKAGGLNLDQCAAEISMRCPVDVDRHGRPVEARCWVATRGWRKSMLKRVDVAYENAAGEVRFASIRFSGQYYTLRLGEQAAT
jgi:hypothetical protein